MTTFLNVLKGFFLMEWCATTAFQKIFNYVYWRKILTILYVLCAHLKDKTSSPIIACCWILLEESSFQKHHESPFDQPSKILQSSLTEYLIPYFTLAFYHVQNDKLSIFPKTPPIVITNAYCMVGMLVFPLEVC